MQKHVVPNIFSNTKTEVLSIQRIQGLHRNQTNKKLKPFSLTGGSELFNVALQTFCAEAG